MTRRLGIGVVGFGWMGQTHTRSYRVLPTHFPDGGVTPEVRMVADTSQERCDLARSRFGVPETTTDWRELVASPEVEIVDVTAPTVLHQAIVDAVAAEGKPVFCEKPVGIDPAATAAIERSARGVISGAGFNYRWAPLVQHAKELLDKGRLGDLTHYRGRFFSMYGRDRLGGLSWRYRKEEGGFGVLTDLMSHVVDMALHLGGPIDSLVSTQNTFVRERPLPPAGGSSHYARGGAQDPRGEVTNEDYVAAMVRFRNGGRGILEADRTMFGPQSQMAFEVNGTKGAAAWDHENLNQLRLYLAEEQPFDGFTEVLAGDTLPHQGSLVPGGGNSIGFEAMKVIEAHEFLRAVTEERRYRPDFGDALDVAAVADTMVRSWSSGTWEQVGELHDDGPRTETGGDDMEVGV